MIERLRLVARPGRLPVALQTEAAECGLACLTMVAAFHGLRLDLAAMRRRFSVSLKGCTMADLSRMAGDLRLHARAVRAEMSHLRQLRRPCILHWDMNHFVVLAAASRRGITIHDPARGRRKLRWDEVSKHFTGVAMEFVPAADFGAGDRGEPVTLRRMLGQVTGLKRSLAQIFILAAALEAFALLSPFLLQWTVDAVLPSADRELLVTLGVGFALLAVIVAATGAARSWAVLYLSSTLQLQWLANVFAHLMRLPVAWFERRHQGDVLSRFGALRRIQETLTTSFVEAVLDGLLVVLTLAMMVLYSPVLAGIASAAIGIYGAMRWAVYRPLRDATEEAIVQDAKTASHFLESLRGVQAIKLFGREVDRQSRYLNLVVEAMNADITTKQWTLASNTVQRLVFGLERVAVVWVGALFVLDRHFSVGMLFAFLAYKEQFTQRLSGLVDKLVELRMLKLQLERLADIVLTAPEQVEPGMPAASIGAPRIEVRGLSFRYADGEPLVLQDCSFTIEPGESVAIVGPSGSGKTTLMKLLLGIHSPLTGEIRVGGLSLAQLGLARWRAMIATVMQDEPLFAGSILDNISFFAAQPQPDWARECATVAAVHDEIAALPMGYETLIGDMGSTLSGGQKQRVLLARALYARPQVLFLDEATSALDVERERQLNQAVRQLALTRVIVAHRPDTIASAGRVIVLHEGRVVQDLRTVGSSSGAPLSA